jgi:hypothetical protein
VLARLLNKKINYKFIKDIDPVLYKTKYINLMAKGVDTPYISIWDIDIVIDTKVIIEAVMKLRNEYDITYPYNGMCFEVPPIIKSMYLSRMDIRLLYRQMGKMELLYERMLVGGAIFMNKQKYIYCGMENEKHYGWGNDDFDRYYRFNTYKLNIYRVNAPLFHLYHPRMNNSGFRTPFHIQKTMSELMYTKNSSKKELSNSIINI